MLLSSWSTTVRASILAQSLTHLVTVISRRGEQGMDEGDLRNFFAKQRQLTKHRQQRLDGGNAGLSKAQRAEMERELQDDVERAIVLLDEREAAVQAGDEMATREWMDIAGFLIDNFREAKALFPHDAVRQRRAVARYTLTSDCRAPSASIALQPPGSRAPTQRARRRTSMRRPMTSFRAYSAPWVCLLPNSAIQH
jgi:hypothetical protein